MSRVDLVLEIRIHDNPKKESLITKIKDLLDSCSYEVSELVSEEYDSEFEDCLESEKEDYCTEIIEIHECY